MSDASPILELAVAIGRISRLDGDELSRRSEETGQSLESILHGGGYLDPEEFDWLTQMALQGFGLSELQKLQRQWFLARVIWSEKLFPEGAEIIPRFLLKNWAQRRTSSLAQLLEERGISSECVFQASQLLSSGLTICMRCLKVLRLRQGVPCPICQGARIDDSEDGELSHLYGCLSYPKPPFLISVEEAERVALETLKRFS